MAKRVRDEEKIIFIVDAETNEFFFKRVILFTMKLEIIVVLSIRILNLDLNLSV